MGHAPGGVDVWWFEDVTAFVGTDDLLTPEESSRAASFAFEQDRRRFVARRGLVKCLLAAQLGCEPTEVVLGFNAFGKPSLETGPYVFNTSSSGNSLLLAIGRRSEVGDLGVDLETMRPMPDALLIAQNFFTHDEAAELGSLTGDERDQAFFNCWTRKEALIKAVGSGVSFGLDRFSVTMLPQESARIRQVDGRPTTWHLNAWSPSPQHIAALATPIEPTEVRMHQIAVAT